MAELEVPRGDDAPVAHLATPQWQSFEIRMRARKADRCLQRAAAALDSGSADDANDALEEARQLSPLDPRLEEFSARLEALKYQASPPSTVRGHFWTSAAVVAGLVVASAAGWETWIHRDQLASLVPKARPDMDASAGLAPTTALSSSAPDASEPALTATDSASARATSTSTDTVVQTTLIRPEQVIDTRDIPLEPRTANETPSVSTSGTAERSDAKTETAKPFAIANAPESPVRPQRDIAPSPQPSPEYRAPAAIPPSPNVTPATNPIPSVAPPPSEPPRPANATNAMMTAPAPNTAPDAAISPATVVPSPPPSTPAASAPPAESSSARDERVAIRAALNRYESAYNRLDVDAVRTIWPTLDQRALARAFDSLTAQRVALQSCNVDVSGSTARANCSGNASWTPKIGGGERSATRKWTFDLSESNGAWRITHVQAR